MEFSWLSRSFWRHITETTAVEEADFSLHRVSKKSCAKLFLSELRQISTNFDNFFAERWQKG